MLASSAGILRHLSRLLSDGAFDVPRLPVTSNANDTSYLAR
jgi:hypothetical protein